MDTSADQTVSTDSLGRCSGPRRQYTLEQKRQIVQETHVRGASVSVVARRHDLNPNQIFAWRRLYRQGLLKADVSAANAPMLPVKVSTPTVVPSERAVQTRREVRSSSAVCEIEIKGRGIPLNADALAALEAVRDQHPRWCFTFSGERIHKSSTVWDKAKRRAGIEDFRFHDLRHTWASWHVQSGTSLPELMELRGWKSYEMVLRYAHLAPEKLSSVASRIERQPPRPAEVIRTGLPELHYPFHDMTITVTQCEP